jgi:3-oxoacyl-[acyl-carrier protein] reductase
MTRTAIVTGASRGIGRAITERLIEDGWRIYNFDREPPSERQDLHDEWVEVDLTDPISLKDALERILAEGPVLGVVNNAGIVGRQSVDDFSVEEFDRVIATNTRSAIQIVQAIVPGMRGAQFGRIVNISSRASLGKHDRSSYAAAKAGLIALAKVWTLELAGDGITCNAIGPGPIQTKLWMAANPPDDPRTKAMVDSVPVGRMGQPADIANAVGFFMDERSSFVSGQILYVCGGITVSRGGS